MSERNEKGRRYRSARDDATVGSIERHIEKTYGLPRNSVQINRPDDSDARSDKKIGNLRKEYDKAK
ncbi:MAG: hypothetical protein GX189_00835 [Clostridiales bacterium]|nr:hypothetical protein [Clostridiales bacterium]